MRDMITGLRILLILQALLVIPAAASPAGHEAPVTIDSLLSSFRQMPGLEARFSEEKRITLLSEPLISEGTLHFVPPDRLARHMLTPVPSSVLVEGSQLSFGDEEGQERIDLEVNPVVRLYVESFLHILEGNRDALEKTWKIELSLMDSGGDDEWEIRLLPSAKPLAKTISELRLRGRGTLLTWMKIEEPTGDETITTFFDVDPGRQYSESDLEKLFRIRTPRE
jgi:hypothetical protein